MHCWVCFHHNMSSYFLYCRLLINRDHSFPRHMLTEFRPPYCMYTWFHHEIHDCHLGFDGRNTENIELNLSEILPVYLIDRLYLSVAVSGDKYCIFGWAQCPWHLLEHWPRASTFITVICSGFVLILLFMLILNIYVYLVKKTRNCLYQH